MRSREADFLNTKTGQPEFSLQVYDPYRKVWAFVHENGKPCIYLTTKERDKKRKELRKQPFPKPQGLS